MFKGNLVIRISVKFNGHSKANCRQEIDSFLSDNFRKGSDLYRATNEGRNLDPVKSGRHLEAEEERAFTFTFNQKTGRYNFP